MTLALPATAAIGPRRIPRSAQSRAKTIMREFAMLGGVQPDDLLASKLDDRLLRLRDMAVCACRENGMTLMQIGRAFKRDHTTIGAALRREEKRRRVASEAP